MDNAVCIQLKLTKGGTRFQKTGFLRSQKVENLVQKVHSDLNNLILSKPPNYFFPIGAILMFLGTFLIATFLFRFYFIYLELDNLLVVAVIALLDLFIGAGLTLIGILLSISKTLFFGKTRKKCEKEIKLFLEKLYKEQKDAFE